MNSFPIMKFKITPGWIVGFCFVTALKLAAANQPPASAGADPGGAADQHPTPASNCGPFSYGRGSGPPK